MKEAVISVALACAGIAVVCGVYWILASFEADTYNRLCQPQRPATTWDAFTVELRVDTCNR